jgi:prepilin-type N-terminal cleavage/methylation domain-containing protein/prepilin-type processing-associated H-X9-DG protein
MVRGRHAHRSAFTLIELLVVISVVAMLVAILLPMLSKSRAQAHAAVCGSNERQQGVAMIGYTVEFRDYFVNPWFAEKKDTTASAPPDGRERDIPFAVLLHHYLAAPIGTWTDADGERVVGLATSNLRNAWTCPQGRPGWDTYSGIRTTIGAGNYTINPFVYNFYPPGANTSSDADRYGPNWAGTLYKTGFRRVTLTRRPSTSIMISEGYVNYNNWSNGTVTAPNWPLANHAACIPNMSNSRYLWHADIGNYVFVDGHVGRIKQSIFKTHEATYRPELYRMAHGQENLKGILPH